MDIVKRLRDLAKEWFEMCDNIHEPLAEAADEIERLRDALKQIAQDPQADWYVTKLARSALQQKESE